MADGGKKTIVASGYKQVGSRATPEAITKEIKKLPASTGPLDGRKRALHDLAHALAYVQEQHKQTVTENCKNENGVGLLIALLNDIDTAPPVPASEDVIRVGRRVLGMGPMDARLYVLSCFVNLAYLGGAGQLRLPPESLSMSGEALPTLSCVPDASRCLGRLGDRGAGRACRFDPARLCRSPVALASGSPPGLDGRIRHTPTSSLVAASSRGLFCVRSRAAMEVLFDTLLITQDSESVLFYAVAGLYNLSNDVSFAQMASRKPGVLGKLQSLGESANPDTVK